MNAKNKAYTYNKEKVPYLAERLKKEYLTPLQIRTILEFKSNSLKEQAITQTTFNLMNSLFDDSTPIFHDGWRGYKILTQEDLDNYENKHKTNLDKLLKEAEDNFNKEW